MTTIVTTEPIDFTNSAVVDLIEADEQLRLLPLDSEDLKAAVSEKLAALAWNRDPREIVTHRRAHSAGAQSALGKKPATERVFRPTLRHLADRPGHDHRYAIDPTKLDRELGWRAAESFDTGIEKTVRWYLENDAWWAPILASSDVGQRLGLKTVGA